MKVTGRAEKRGRLIAFEGIDGCGKSTQARLAAERLDALYTFEPGDTELGVSLRRLVLDSDGVLSARAEALMVAADRAQHVDEVLGPALAAGRWVVTDRFNGSTLAYQGAGRGLDPDSLDRVLSFATSGLAADLSILVEVPTDVARGRIGSAQPDRLERLDEDFHRRVAEGYRSLAARDPARWAVVDGTGSIEEVASEVAAVVRQRLGQPEATA
jgi:dTMP kinase